MNSYINLIYDFTRRPYDVDWWGTLVGVPQRVGANLVVAGSSTVMSAEFTRGNLEMEITMNETPTAGDSKKWGWYAPGQDAYAYFEVSGTTFRAATSDGEGNTQTSNITWDDTWLATPTLFKIVWDASGFTFFVNGIRLAKISEDLKMPRVPMSPYLSCLGGIDSMTVSYVSVLGAHTMFHIESVNSDYLPIDPGHTPSVFDTLTITESLTVVPSLAFNGFDSVSIAENVSMFTDLYHAAPVDTVALTENVALLAVMNQGDTLDNLSVSEDVSVDVN